MANTLGQSSQSLPGYVLRDKSRACKQRFRDCFEIPGLEYDDWLEQRCAEFNWWTSGLGADKWGPGSLDSRLKLRPDVIEVVSMVLDGLGSSLSNYYEIGLAASSSPLPEGKLPSLTEVFHQSKVSTDAERSPSPWSDMSDSSIDGLCSSGSCDEEENDAQKPHNDASSDYDIYYEPRVYIKTNLEILIRIHTAIKRSGQKFRNQRADEALKRSEENYQRQKANLGEHNALQGPNGDHERFRLYLTKLVLWNGYTQSLIHTMNSRIIELNKTHNPEDKYISQILRQERTLIIIFRVYFQDSARLTTVQRRLINANVIRRNRLIYAGSVAKPSFQTEEEHQKQPEPGDEVPRPSTLNRTRTVLTSSQPQPPLIAPGESIKGDKETVKGFVAQPATAVDSTFTITGALAPHRVTKSVATKVSARVQYLDYPKCPVKHGQFPCPYCSTMLTDEYTKSKKWRGHVAQDLCAYICVFEDCESPDDMFASTYEWMSHMAKFHCAIGWACLECAKTSASSDQNNSVLSFQSSALLKEHILTSHPTLDPVELDLLVETGKKILRIQRARCPLCRAGLVTLENDDEDGIDGIASLPSMNQEVGLIQLEEDEHIASHIHEFALQSLPYRQEVASEGSQLSFSESSSRSSFELTFQGPEDQETSSIYQSSMYSIDDVTSMLDDLCDSLRPLYSEQDFLDQHPIGILDLIWADNARLSQLPLREDRPLLKRQLGNLDGGIKMLKRGRGCLQGEDIDAFAVALNGTRVTVSQLRDLTADDNIEESLRSQLMHNLDHSSKLLQRAFDSTSDTLIKLSDDKPAIDTEFTTSKEIFADLIRYIKRAGLVSFFPDDSFFLSSLVENAIDLQNSADNLLNRDVDIQGLMRLNLYQPVLYCDDSTSMKAGSRADDQKELVRRVTRVATSIVPAGYGMNLQFINHVRDVHNDKLNLRQVETIINSVKPKGHTEIGTNLKKKILKPLVYDVVKSNKRLERPILVYCITDGCPSDEDPKAFKKEILKCTRFLKDNGYPPSTIRFQIGQIGNSFRADAFLQELRDDDELSEVLYCTAQHLDDRLEEFRHNEVLLERWLLRTLLEPIMDPDGNNLNLQHD